jgi:hypothetical protein
MVKFDSATFHITKELLVRRPAGYRFCPLVDVISSAILPQLGNGHLFFSRLQASYKPLYSPSKTIFG